MCYYQYAKAINEMEYYYLAEETINRCLELEENDDVENDENEGYETPEEDAREVERILSEW